MTEPLLFKDDFVAPHIHIKVTQDSVHTWIEEDAPAHKGGRLLKLQTSAHDEWGRRRGASTLIHHEQAE